MAIVETAAWGSRSERGGSRGMARTELKIEQEFLKDSDVVVLQFGGDIDAHTSKLLQAAIGDVFFKDHYKLVIDLKSVKYMSSAGAAVLLSSLEEARTHEGNIVLMNPAASVQHVMELLGILPMFKITNSRDTALEFFQAKSS